MKYAEKPASRNTLGSASWGKRVAVLALLLMARTASAQSWDGPERAQRGFSPRITSELNRELSQARKGLGGDKSIRVIVQYKSSPRSETLARLQNRGGRLGGRLESIRGAAFTVPVNALAALEKDPDVEYVSVDHPVKGMDDYTNDAMNVRAAWDSGYNGAGIGVAVIDSGVDPNHADWNDASNTSRVLYHQDFTGASTHNSQGTLVYDTYGHGTHVAGIIAGNGNKSSGVYTGVASMANVIDLRVLDEYGNGSDSNVIAAIERAIALKNTYNIRIINLSLGRGVFVGYEKDPLCQAVESAWKSGIVVVVAAGNYGRISVNGSDGYGTVAAPGNDPFVITVGAMKTMGTDSRTDDLIASYSSKGPTTYDHVVKPDLVAPGNMVVSLSDADSTLANEFPGNMVAGNSNDYFILSGTSMATPAAAGAVALLLQQHPSLTPDEVKARLMKTAYKTFPTSSVATDPLTGKTYTSYYDIFTVGSGYLDVAAALSNNDVAPSTLGSGLSPSASYNSSTKKVTLSNGNSTVAGSSVIWGTSVVWGTSVIWGTNTSGSSVIWGTSVVWGTTSNSGFSVIWGTTSNVASSVIWGTALTSPDAAFATILGE